MPFYRVRAKKMFADKVEKKTHKVNDEFIVDEDRLDALQKASSSLVEVLEELDSEDGLEETNKPEKDLNEKEEADDQEEKETETDESSVQVEVEEAKDIDDIEEPAVKAEEKTEYPLHVGGPYYMLSNGDQVKGKAAAAKAEKELGD